MDEKLKEKSQERRLLASEAFEVIGEGNKEISVLRAESGVLETRMRQLYAEIGRYVSRHADAGPRLRRGRGLAPRSGRCDARPAPLDRAQPPPCRHRLISRGSVTIGFPGATREGGREQGPYI